MSNSLAWHQGFAAGREFERNEREWARGAVERDLRGVTLPPPAQPDCPYDEEPDVTLPPDQPSQMCPICGIPLVHEKCPICAVPHAFSPYADDVPYRWCKVCGLDEGDLRAYHEAA